MDKIAAQTWFSRSIYYSRSEVLYEILGNVKNSEFVRPKQQLHFSPASTQNSAVFSTWTWSSSKKWPQKRRSSLLAGDLTPNAPRKPSQLQLAWRAAAFPALEGGGVTPGDARGNFWCSGGAGASASLSSSEDSESHQPGSPGNPCLACHEHQAPARATSQHRRSQRALCRAAGCRQASTVQEGVCEPQHPLSTFPLCPNALRNRALLPPSREVLSPALLLVFGCYFRCVVIHWCSS